MKNITLDQATALENPASVIATIWRITRLDGVVLRLTDLDTAFPVDGETYLANGSTERTSIKMGNGTAANNLDINGIMSSELITEVDLESGRYDFAKIEIGLGFADSAVLPPIWMCTGTFGEIEYDNGGYRTEINDLSFALQSRVGATTSPNCRADFGDSMCRASLTTWRASYTLASVTDSRTLVLTGPSLLPSGTYANGLIEMTSGDADGLKMEVRSWDAGTLTLGLYLPLTILPEAGDTLLVTAGCDKLAATCRTVFDNRINFQGEAELVGVDFLAAPPVE